MNLTEYVRLPIEERQAHLDLSAPCQLEKRRKWTHQKDQLLQQFNVTNDSSNWLHAGIHRCHACINDSQGPLVCLNPKHWWIGTSTENAASRPLEKRQAGGKATRGIAKSETSIAKRAEALRGLKRTAEQRKRMSDSHKGKFFWITDGTRSVQHRVGEPIPAGWYKGRILLSKA